MQRCRAKTSKIMHSELSKVFKTFKSSGSSQTEVMVNSVCVRNNQHTQIEVIFAMDFE